MAYKRIKELENIIDRDKNTILRWEREGKIPPAKKDSRGWRFYTEDDIEMLKNYLRRTNSFYDI